jgi:hypothetical protein
MENLTYHQFAQMAVVDDEDADNLDALVAAAAAAADKLGRVVVVDIDSWVDVPHNQHCWQDIDVVAHQLNVGLHLRHTVRSTWAECFAAKEVESPDIRWINIQRVRKQQHINIENKVHNK